MSRSLLVLSSKLTLTAGQSLVDTDVYVPETFAYDSAQCAILITGHGVTLRNVKLYTYASESEFLDAWMDDPVVVSPGVGIPWTMVGIRANAVKSLTMESVHIEGFPRQGFLGYQLEDATFRRCSGTKCFAGFGFSWQSRANKRVKIAGMAVYDTWGPGDGVWPGVGGEPSVKRPGYFIGGDGLTGYFDDFCFERLNFHGEMFSAFKIVRSKRGAVLYCKGNQMFLQGTEGRNANVDLTTDGTTGVVFRLFDVNKSYGVGHVTDESNGIQISYNVTDCVVADGRVSGTGKNGHGIELSGDCEVDVRGNVIGGFNLLRGSDPAYGMHVHDGSSVNADVLTENDFTDQQRSILMAA